MFGWGLPIFGWDLSIFLGWDLSIFGWLGPSYFWLGLYYFWPRFFYFWLRPFYFSLGPLTFFWWLGPFSLIFGWGRSISGGVALRPHPSWKLRCARTLRAVFCTLVDFIRESAGTPDFYNFCVVRFLRIAYLGYPVQSWMLSCVISMSFFWLGLFFVAWSSLFLAWSEHRTSPSLGPRSSILVR